MATIDLLQGENPTRPGSTHHLQQIEWIHIAVIFDVNSAMKASKAESNGIHTLWVISNVNIA